MLTLTDYNLTQLTSVLQSHALPSFKVRQIYVALCRGEQFEQMTELSKPLRARLAEEFYAQGASIIQVFTSLDGTEKFLFALADGNVVEGVLMRYSYGNTLCISTQVGCRMGCAFCASTLGGLVRNCTVGEMFSFVSLVNRYAASNVADANAAPTLPCGSDASTPNACTADFAGKCPFSQLNPTLAPNANPTSPEGVDTNNPTPSNQPTPNNPTTDSFIANPTTPNEVADGVTHGTSAPQRRRGVTNIVLMGSGEPLDNYDNVLAFLRRINEREGLNISYRNVSLSTCGLIEQIRRFADERTGVNLTISLHSPTQPGREQLIPAAKANPLPQLMDAARYYFKRTKRRVIFEYTLVSGANDSDKDARTLAALVKGFPTHVNLIRLNPVKERALSATTQKRAQAFLKMLTSLGVSATLRRTVGSDVGGACGQLRRAFLDAKDNK